MDNQNLSNQNIETSHSTTDSQSRVADDHYDRAIPPAETSARQEREGDAFKKHPTETSQQHAENDDQTDASSVSTTHGYTVDREGLLNNYAIEPEMYVNEPGDLRESEEDLAADRMEEISEANQDKKGKLTMDHDDRGRGPGLI